MRNLIVVLELLGAVLIVAGGVLAVRRQIRDQRRDRNGDGR